MHQTLYWAHDMFSQFYFITTLYALSISSSQIKKNEVLRGSTLFKEMEFGSLLKKKNDRKEIFLPVCDNLVDS